MMDFCLKNNDLEIINSDISLCHSDIDAIAQVIAIRLKILAGEWFLDKRLGIPYLSQILGKKRNDRFITRLLTKEIEVMPYIKEIKDIIFNENTETRSMSIKFKVILNNLSTITINESIGV